MAEGTCSVKGCGRYGRLTRGWCGVHYRRWRVHGDVNVTQFIRGDDLARLQSKIARRGEDECWPWLGYVDDNGYGRFSSASWSGVLAHRAVYELMVEPIPDGMTIDHVRGRGCARRDCVNYLRHLEVVTLAENNLRSDSPSGRNARKTHCIRGHEFTPENTRHRSTGGRRCVTCSREMSLRYYLEHKGGE